MATCPNCGNETLEGAVFCDQCGTRLPAPEAADAVPAATPAAGSAICPACGAGNVPGEAFCDYCGSPLEAPVPTAEAVPELEPVAREAELEVVAEPAEEAAIEAAAPADAGDEGKLTCPACAAEVLPGEAFCADCGASLAQPPIPPEPEVVEEEAAPAPELPPEPPDVPVEVTEEAAPEPVIEEPTVVPAAVVEEPPPEPVAEPEPVVEPALPPPPGPPTCPACSAEIEAGDKFCSNCGYKLEAEPAPAPVAPAPPPPALGPRLVVVASGAEIPLQAGGEILIGREDPISGIFPDVDLTPHEGEEGGVSRQHARLTIEGANYYVEDLDSTNYTFVNKQKLAPKTRHPLNDGDEIRCGRVALVLKTG